ncbi:lysophospholipase L1-like esterase [Pedobacter sp. AK013]|uniref:GDSL-type esterase/lipase family protein n=1 Tax=Pedobacter sp. AK013 TaxID=2723071 RepID=UPI0016152175|nr:GDSL-type esterase/lipase family protein [Pedobacter sp. AK013]MBB6236860.1 lysophospholipase L1-like esterase [Pedobacter sp. AK013]
MGKRKEIYFKAAALALPLVFLCFIEILLRLFNYGFDPSLFIKDPDEQGYMMMNPTASYKFFSTSANATQGNRERFSTVKSKNTFRIFVIGESTTAGYPYMHNGSFHRWLQYRLMHQYPSLNFEVINVSLTAVNSYTVLDFAKQIVNDEPDLVLVYTGHNEYYGALGIGSTSQIKGNNTWIKLVIKLREFKLVQLSDRIIEATANLFGKRIDKRENLMKRMVTKQQIAYQSADFKRGITQFSSNMGELCQLLSKKHIPTIISTLVSNEKDLQPFISSGKFSAQNHYAIGKKLYINGDFKAAKANFVLAKEYDQLRFRAPEAFNQIIKKLCRQYPGIYLADTRALFEKNETGGIIGKETILEHVHPNLLGYAVMSESFYQQINNGNLIPAKKQSEISFAQLLANMPVTKVDSLYGVYQIMMLRSGWPFNEPITSAYNRGNSIDEQLAGALAVDRITWRTAMDELYKNAMANGDKQKALKVTEAVLLENPYQISYYTYAGRLGFELADLQTADFYFKKAYDLAPTPENANNLFLFYFKSDLPEKALQYNDILKHAGRQSYLDTQTEEILKNIIKLKKEAPSNNNNELIANYFHQLSADETAAKYIKKNSR